MADAFPRMKVAAVQASSIYMDKDATIRKACRLIEEAADRGARVVGFPESFVSGYPFFYLTLLTNPFAEEKKRFLSKYVVLPDTKQMANVAA